MWRRGRDVRFKGSQIDQVMGGAADAETQPVPLFEKNVDVVEFAPPEGLRPGQVGTLIDEGGQHARRERHDRRPSPSQVPGDRGDARRPGCSARPTGTCASCPTPRATTSAVRAEAARRAVRGRDQVELSELRKTFAERLQKVKDALYNDMVSRKWFLRRPDRVRQIWVVIGSLALSAGIALTIVLASSPSSVCSASRSRSAGYSC
jgi:hypothetical protein